MVFKILLNNLLKIFYIHGLEISIHRFYDEITLKFGYQKATLNKETIDMYKMLCFDTIYKLQYKTFNV